MRAVTRRALAHQPRQLPGQVVDINGWSADEDFPFLTLGTQPKRFVICPDPAPFPFLIAGHRYIFKAPEGRHVQQTWAEVLAYEFARPLAAPVPPAFIALSGETCGVLVESFINYPTDTVTTQLAHASNGMTMLLDHKRGRPHGVRENILLCRHMRVEEPVRWWAQALAFDAMIGNVDRHPDNWGFLQEGGSEAVLMAPLYDNASSFGHGELDEKIARKFATPQQVASFVAKGAHHCGWSAEQDAKGQHAALCGRFVQAYGYAREVMEQVATLAEGDIDAVVGWATDFDVPLAFTGVRAAFVAEQLRARRIALLAALKD